MTETPAELHGHQARRAAQIKEYGTYVAAEQVFDPATGALIYDVGHPIPVSNVDETDGRIIVGRHYCGDPDRGGHEMCDEHNNPLAHTEPGVAVKRTTRKAPAKSARTSSATKEG